jgi:hypothetical protein
MHSRSNSSIVQAPSSIVPLFVDGLALNLQVSTYPHSTLQDTMVESDSRTNYLPLAATELMVCSVATVLLWSRQSNKDFSKDSGDETLIYLILVEKAMAGGITIPALNMVPRRLQPS